MSGGAIIDPPLSAAERAHRSVFVGNIPYEATEEQLREIFVQAGTIVSFRLVYDRETGKPKGYGFCEYQDTETAQSAMRNLNNHDFNGRPLRVGVAAGDQNKDDMKGMQQAVGGPTVESPYGEAVEPEKAPEAISKAVASLPPEQMFELMKQMKLCIQNNPNEARNMLLQNPQLAYALLQAQIVMKIVDPQVAMAMLHRDRSQIPPVLPSEDTSAGNPSGNLPMQVVAQMQGGAQAQAGPQNQGAPQIQGGPPVPEGMHMQGAPQRGLIGPGQHDGPMQQGRPGPPQMQHTMGPRGPMPGLLPGLGGPLPQRPPIGMPGGRDMGPGGAPRPGFPPPEAVIRGPQPEMDRMRGQPEMDRMRGQPEMERMRQDMDRMRGQPEMDRMRQQEMEHMRGQEMERMRAQQEIDRMRGQPDREHMRGQPEMERMRGQPEMRAPQPEIRERDIVGVPPPQPRSQPSMIPGLSAAPAASASPAPPSDNISSQDQEKAALIMQVLQLTDQQIAMLPPEQRQSILILKDQIANQRQ